MKRYNSTLSDKRGAFGLCMEEHKDGMFVPFSEVEQLQAKLFELQEKFHRTGVAIERAISTGSVLADHPLKSRLELLANHHEREMELAAQLSDATRQCGVMAGLLREVTQVIPAIGVAIDDLPVVDAFLERIEAALAGKLPEPASSGNVDWSRFPGWLIDHHEGDTITEEMLQFALSDMLAAAPKPEPTKGRTITEGQEFELTTVLQAIASGFSDDPSHDAAALLKRITGEVPWTGDSFRLPPRQGGEPCATEPRSSSPD